MGGGNNGWFMVYMGDEVEDMFALAHVKTIGDENYKV
jgi:hypothetical protein